MTKIKDRPDRKKNPADILDEAAWLVDQGNWAKTEYEFSPFGEAQSLEKQYVNFNGFDTALEMLIHRHQRSIPDLSLVDETVAEGKCYCALGAIMRCTEGAVGAQLAEYQSVLAEDRFHKRRHIF